jgi:hypothetical protein
MVTESAEFKLDKDIPVYEPYKLDKSCLKLPTELYIDFIAKDNIRYVYEIGFTATKIMYENLRFYPKLQPATLIERKYGETIKYGEYLTGRKKDIEDKLYENQLFLSKVSTDRLERLSSAYLFFSEGIYVSTFHDTKYDNLLIQTFTTKLAKDDIPFFKENINNLMRVADTGIDYIDIKEIEIDINTLPEEMSVEKKQELVESYKQKIRTIHKKFDGEKEDGIVEFKLNEESTGTIKLLAIGGLILEALADGQVLIY